MDLTKREKIGLIVFLVIILSVISIMYFNKNKNDSVEVISKTPLIESNKEDTDNSKHNSADIKVYISGEIKKPGVYTLSDGDRVERLVDLAGGFTTNADSTSLNLAMKLKDEDYIRVPDKRQSAAVIPNTAVLNNGSKEGTSAIININTATKEQLMELPRIGEAIAQRIIDYREKTGSFKDIKNITDVSGIGPKLFENIKDKITVH